MGFYVSLAHREPKKVSLVLSLEYLSNPLLAFVTEQYDFISKWRKMRATGVEFFSFLDDNELGTENFGNSLAAMFHGLGFTPPKGYYYASHSLRIGSFIDLVNLQLSRRGLIQWLDWSTEVIFQAYFYGLITMTADSGLFFVYMRSSEQLGALGTFSRWCTLVNILREVEIIRVL